MSLFELQAGAFGVFPLAGLSLGDELVEMSLFGGGHLGRGVSFVDSLLHAGEPIRIAGGAGGAERHDERQMIELHRGWARAAAEKQQKQQQHARQVDTSG